MSLELLLPGATTASVARAATGAGRMRVDGDRLDVRPDGARAGLRATLHERADGVLVVGEVRRRRWTSWSVSVLVMAVGTVAGVVVLLATGHPVWAVLALVLGGAATASWWLGLLVTTGNTQGAVESLLRDELVAVLGGAPGPTA